MPKVTAVLFDYGLVLSGPPDPAAWAKMRRITGFSEDALHRAYWQHRNDYDRGVVTGDMYWQRVISRAQLPTEVLEALLDADLQLWTQLNLPMVQWARQLQQAGVRTGILSNLGDAMAAGVVSRFDWIAHFDHLTWSHTLKLTKPDPAIYLHAANGLDTPVERILFIDDRAENTAAARKVGMQAIEYHDLSQFKEELLRLDTALPRPTLASLLPQKG